MMGNYVKTFAEATHALPDGMHMNADYPLKIARVVAFDNGYVTLEDRERFTAKIIKGKRAEYCILSQSSSYEKTTSSKPTRFRFYPFKQESEKEND